MSRKPYQDYPEYYFTIIEHFETSVEIFTVKGTWGELTSTRHAVNRFFKALQRAAEEDDYARKLYRIAEKLRLSISPGRASYQTDAIMNIKLDPLYKAIMVANMPVGE